MTQERKNMTNPERETFFFKDSCPGLLKKSMVFMKKFNDFYFHFLKNGEGLVRA